VINFHQTALMLCSYIKLTKLVNVLLVIEPVDNAWQAPVSPFDAWGTNDQLWRLS